jgi:uracil-DNA glycosylase
MNTVWENLLRNYGADSPARNLCNAVELRRRAGEIIYPGQSQIFHALELTPPEKVRVVILGQDPYHGPDQAMGLSFSVPRGVPLPPSLKNIYKELSDDIGCEIPSHGDLTHWASQGVLLLNSSLSVSAGLPGSHSNIGWQNITDTIICALSEHYNNIVFILWGNHAIAKSHLIDTSRHLIITAPHPSPLSAYRGFFGGRYFSRANKYLNNHGRGLIDWSISNKLGSTNNK